VILFDAVRSRNALSGISVEAPAIARMSTDRGANLGLKIRNPGLKARNLALGVALPPEIQSPSEETWIALPAGAEWSRFHWACKPLSRGKFRTAWVYLEAASPLGFWAVRKTAPLQSEIRVYPNLLSERKDLAALFLRRGAFGLHVQRQVGKGRDFEKLREYIPGDSFDDIHWKATARRGKPITKVFQIERTQEIYVVVDASRLSARQSILERFVTASLVLGLAAEQQGDLFGLLT